MKSLQIPFAFLALCSCDSEWSERGAALNSSLPADTLVGCYYSEQGLPIIEIGKDQIFADGALVHSEFSYGLGGRGNQPMIVAEPRMVLSPTKQGDEVTYKFEPWKSQSVGSVTYIVDRTKGGSISLYSIDAVQHHYRKYPCS